jgi:hypothetical protein
MSTPLTITPRMVFVTPEGKLTPEAFRAMQAIIQRLGGAASDDVAAEFADVFAPFVVQETLPEMLMQPVPAEVGQFHDIAQPAQPDCPLAYETTYQG